MSWTPADIGDQTGRTAVVTGANTGLGLETARGLARAGARVVLAARDLEKGGAAVADVRASVPGADLELQQLDLSSLDRVRQAAAELVDRHDRIDLLVNNAGIMYTPFATTEDGFEQQIGVNHLGHFALTALLLPRMADVEGSRIVSVASNGHKAPAMGFHIESITGDRGYDRYRAYHRSKLANLLFTYALDRRLADAGARTIALAAHPGFAATELARHIRVPGFLLDRLMPLVSQPAEEGAHPQLRAATDPEAGRATYWGPDGVGELQGAAVQVRSTSRSHDTALQEGLWTMSEQLTGVSPDL